MTHLPIFVIKNSGKKEFFQPHKLKESLQRTKASPKLIKNVLDYIEKNVKNGMTTHDIYKKTFSLLKEHPEPAKHYSLKRTIMDLGPDGHNFEQFVAKLFIKLGYHTKTNQIVQGHCVTHEVDVVASNEEEMLFIECKFHNLPGTKSNIKTALYVHARGEDIKNHIKLSGASPTLHHKVGLVTNTSLTADAIQYGLCKNMHLLAWNYPPNEGLETLMTRHNLYPV